MNQLTQQLYRLCIIRTVLITVLLALSLFLEQALNAQLPLWPLALVMLAGLGLNALTLWRLQRHQPCSEPEFCLQLLLDILWLASYLYLAGGVSNPLISSFLIPVALAAIALPWRLSGLILLASALAYSLLMKFFHPLAPSGEHTSLLIHLHLWGMWANYLLSAGLICLFVGQSARSLRRYEAERAAQRECQLRNEQLVGIALQAAGTAHELGTPLNSAQLICDDLVADTALPAELREDLSCLQQQLERCRHSLRQLGSRCQEQPNGPPQRMPALELIEQLEQHWQLLRPSVPLAINAEVSGSLRAELSLQQALLNLLNNAADASPQGIALHAYNHGEQLLLELHDSGPGIDPAIAEELGHPFISSKNAGLGLGWYLSQATLERFGGRVSLHNRPEGGTLTLIELPLADHEH